MEQLAGILPLLLIFVVFYFLLIRPQQKKLKDHKNMIANLKKGDRIVTQGGIIGNIHYVNDDGTLSVEELADATGLSIEESKELHKEADKDDDGKMSLSEFVASSAAEKVAANLPRPVAPVRKQVLV